MRFILDTDKKTITVPHNYQAKLNEMNKLIVEYSDGKKEPRPLLASFTKSGITALNIPISAS